MRFRLHTLMILLAVLPPLLAAAYTAVTYFAEPPEDQGWGSTVPVEEVIPFAR